MRVLLLGPPGAGKGTQGQRLSQALGIPHIATGDIIRDEIARRTDFGRKIEAGIAAGNFAPDDEIAKIVTARVGKPDAEAGYILDGFPRDLAQARAFDGQAAGRAFDAVIELTVSEEQIVKRLAGRLVCPKCERVFNKEAAALKAGAKCEYDGSTLVRRPDDAPDAVKHRIRIYEEMTLPLRKYYSSQGILRSIRGDLQPDNIFEQVQDSLRAVKRSVDSGAASGIISR